MRECTKCKCLKPETAYPKNKSSWCKKCKQVGIEQWRAENQDHVREKNRLWQRQWRKNNPDKAKDKYLRRKYGITLDQYNQMLINQNHQCEICTSKTAGTNDWNLDHCHKTGKIRGILCQDCNHLLGVAKDNTTILQNAIKYLDRNQSIC